MKKDAKNSRSSQPEEEQVIGGGEGDGSPRATSHTGQAPAGTPPGEANTRSGALDTGPKADQRPRGTNQ